MQSKDLENLFNKNAKLKNKKNKESRLMCNISYS